MSKEFLLNLKCKSEKININGEEYEVREMTAQDGTDYQTSLFKFVNGKPVPNLKDATTKLIQLCLYKNNEQVFKKNDLSLINQMPSSIVNEIASVAQKINNLNGEETVKN